MKKFKFLQWLTLENLSRDIGFLAHSYKIVGDDIYLYCGEINHEIHINKLAIYCKEYILEKIREHEENN